MSNNSQTHTFSVTGRIGFPFDMLRYDRCYPANETTAWKIGREGEERTIELMGSKPPTPGRWSSFGWTVRP